MPSHPALLIPSYAHPQTDFLDSDSDSDWCRDRHGQRLKIFSHRFEAGLWRCLGCLVQQETMLYLMALLSFLTLADSFMMLTPTPGSFRRNPRCASTACARRGLREVPIALGHGQPTMDGLTVFHRSCGPIPLFLRNALHFSTNNKFSIGSMVKLLMTGAERGVMLSADDDVEAERLWLEVRCKRNISGCVRKLCVEACFIARRTRSPDGLMTNGSRGIYIGR